MTEYWCVKDYDDWLLTYTLAFRRDWAIEMFLKKNECPPDETWKKCYRHGFRCVKVRIEEVEK